MLLKKLCILSILMSSFAFGENVAVNHSEKLIADGKYILVSKKNLNEAMPAKNKDGSINVLVEIPSGTNGKWEVNKESGNLEWEFKRCSSYGANTSLSDKLRYDTTNSFP